MAKAFDISNQLKFAADYYKHTLVSLDEGNSFSNSELSTKAQNGQFNVAVEKVTIERIRGDASLRLAICLLKLNSNETAPASFLSDSFAYLTKAIDVYRMQCGGKKVVWQDKVYILKGQGVKNYYVSWVILCVSFVSKT